MAQRDVLPQHVVRDARGGIVGVNRQERHDRELVEGAEALHDEPARAGDDVLASASEPDDDRRVETGELVQALAPMA